MSYLYFKKKTFFKIKKINYYSPKIWRYLCLLKLNPIYILSEKKFFNRSSVVLKIFINKEILIHSGKKWHKKYINKWMVGYKFGEFTWNRKLALYKTKQLKKKKK